MEMRIRARAIKKLRQERAWSQQHLADASGISLRTVQRIEKTGQASPESIKALAASFGINASELVEAPSGLSHGRRRKGLAIGIPVIAGVVASWVFVATIATAEPVMLGVSFSSDGEQLADVQLLTDSGQPAEVILDNGWKVSLAPTITPEGQVRIEAKIYEQAETGDWSLVSSPVLITDYRKAAGVRYEGENRGKLDFAVTPE
jgi:DNA-binding XRE family transcriptional regulator